MPFLPCAPRRLAAGASLAALCAAALGPAPAWAQLRAQPVAAGLYRPVGLVQDPSLPNVQYVMQQDGHIRVILDGALVEGDFLDLGAETIAEGENGLLGLVFAPDYAWSGRLWVTFTNLDGHVVLARFLRSGEDPLRADPATRFDFIWPDGAPYIEQPFGMHHGGDMHFGPDGYLYLSLGDGGDASAYHFPVPPGEEPPGEHEHPHAAQHPMLLLGKMLRLDVNVGDEDPEGYDVPADNPFVGVEGVLWEIWSFGLRNPWRFSIDDPARGGTGALVIADVGEHAREEINYEPAGQAGRNYGWPTWEGTALFVEDHELFPAPLVFPIHEDVHPNARSYTGGFVYRGTALGPAYVGRYFFADFIRGRIWSLGLTVDPGSGEAAVRDVVEHTSELFGAHRFIAGFGLDADGEIYITTWLAGGVFRIAPGDPCAPATLTPPSATFPGGGGPGWVGVGTPAHCPWTAVSESDFLTILGGSQGFGPGEVAYDVDVNDTDTGRVGTLLIGGATFTVTQLPLTISVTPASLRYGATKNGVPGDLVAVTPPQAVTVDFTGTPAAWTATVDELWLQVTGGSGTGPGAFTVAVVNPFNVIGGNTRLEGSITLSAPDLGATIEIPVVLDVQLIPAASAPPFGQVDTPEQGAGGQVGAIGVTGWALDDVGVAHVKVYRTCFAFDNPASCQSILGQSVVFVGDAAFLAGARPDVEAAFPGMPQPHRAGWGMQILTNMLPHVPLTQLYGGQGPIQIFAFATDLENRVTLLGRTQFDSTPTSITMDNDNIAKPFGTADTPVLGATVSGLVPAFLWALTPDTDTVAGNGDILIPIDGSTMVLFVDGFAVATVAYDQCRGTVGNPVPEGVFCDDDVANVFGNASPQPPLTARTANPTRFRNLDAGRGAIGVSVLDTTLLSNGLHTVAWSVTDSDGRVEGIGSRFFTVLNGGAPPVRGFSTAPAVRGDARAVTALPATAAGVAGRAGFDLAAPFVTLPSRSDGARAVRLPELGRMELAFGAPVDAAYLAANGELRDLPIGARLDGPRGVFTWAPPAGYVGTYRLAFVTGGGQVTVDVTVQPRARRAPGEGEIRMHLELPVQGAAAGAQFLVAGWAVDPDAFAGAGIGAVHAWARRREAAGGDPVFLGAATLGVPRPDVAQAQGAGAAASGFTLVTSPLAPGEYDVTVYAWSARTGRWEDARTVTVNVR